MSASMIRRGLELFGDDKKGKKRSGFGRGSSSVSGPRRRPPPFMAPPGLNFAARFYFLTLAAVGARRTKKKQPAGEKRAGGLTAQLSSSKRPGSTRQRATVKNKRVKSALEEFLKTQKSHLSANLNYFRGTEYRPTQSDTVKIMLQSKSRQSRDRPDAPAAKPKEKTSLFTEEEFQRFQLEYFGRKVEGGDQ